MAPRRVTARRLAQGLSERPGVLGDGRSPAPKVVGTLLVELRRRGAEAISAPRCAGCDKEMRSFCRRGENWYCSVCGRARVACTACGSPRQVGSVDREGRPFCHDCPVQGEDPVVVVIRLVTGTDPSLGASTVAAAVESVTSRVGERRRLAWALEDRPALLTGAGAEAPVPSVLRLIDALAAAGATEIVRPACPHCRRVVKLSRIRDGVRLCRGCEARLRAVPCARCGAVRDPATRDDEGRPVCPNCFIRDSSNQEVCVGCGRRRPVSVRGPDGPRCPSCRPVKEMTCSICGRLGPAEIAKATGEPWCLVCQKRWARCAGCGQVRPVRGGSSEHPLCATCTRTDASFWKTCPSCGEATKLTTEACVRCELRARLHQLLVPGGVMIADLAGLHDSLAGAQRPDLVLRWLKTSSGTAVLADIGAGRLELTHETLDGLGRTKTVEHLRAVLVATAALAARDEQMARLEAWIEDIIAGRTEPEEQYVLRRYALWHLLRRLRRRARGAETTYGQAIAVKRHVRATIALLDWLAGLGLDLASADQGHLDAWLASDGVFRQADVGHFIRWAGTHKLTNLQLGAARWTGPSGVIDADKRWDQARWLLADDSVATADRVTGLLVLLYAQRASAISRLTLAHVEPSTEGLRLRLGARPLVLPQPLDDLVACLITSRQGHASLGDTGTSPWLFPGGQPGRPISAARLTERLRDLGIHAGPARTAALMQLATELPAAVIARMLGLHIKVAVEWQRAASGDWTGYAADYSRRDTDHR
ncbi:MAG TPA: hypothetical protein VMV14_04905 [Acidimicrobiales bacterium]|nr:hypothetical protein [Acidimicrobiales bacterium]